MSIEGSKFLMKDLRPELSWPIEEIEKEHSDLFERARRELETITPLLKDLVARVENEKPDSVLFLDKGARILAANRSSPIQGLQNLLLNFASEHYRLVLMSCRI